jgi:hypothetical protein
MPSRVYVVYIRARTMIRAMATQTNRVWNPSKYLQFEDERLRPALDLLHQIPDERVESVIRASRVGGGPRLRHREHGADGAGHQLIHFLKPLG